MDGFADEEYFQTDEIIWIVVVVHLENYKKGSFNREILSRELFDFFSFANIIFESQIFLKS